MEPIISPWFVFLIGIVDNVSLVFSPLAVISGLLFVFAIVVYVVCKAEKEDITPTVRAVMFMLGIVFSFSISLVTVTPSSKTVMAMYAASVSIPDNINKVLDSGKSFKDEIKQDILDILEHGVKEGNSGE